MSTSKTKKPVSSLELKDSANSSSKIIHDETLTKADLAEVLFDQIGINKREAKELVDVFFEEIRNTLIDGQPVKLSGFGNFLLRDKSSRPGRNPRTGEVVDIAPRRVVTFHPSAKLKSRIADQMLEQFE